MLNTVARMSIYAIVTVQIRTVYIIKIKSERMLTMTVNLTINDISAKEALNLLQLAQTFNVCADKAEKSTATEDMKDFANAVNDPAEEVSEANKDAKKSESTTDVITIEEVRSAFANFAKKNGKDAAKELLKRFNATKVTELRENDYGAVISAIKEG